MSECANGCMREGLQGEFEQISYCTVVPHVCMHGMVYNPH